MFIRTTALTPIELRTAIVREPLVVSPDTTVMDAIAQMSGVRSLCNTPRTADGQLDDLHKEARSSCVLVVENEQLVGVLTERDVVRLSAQQRSLENLALREVMAHPVVTLRESAFTDLFFAINLLQQHHIRHLPIVDELDRLVGLVTHETLRQISRPIDLLRLRIVAEVMTREVICAAPDSSLLAIVQLMAEHRVSSVMIVHPGRISTEPLQIPVGIITERDIVQFQTLGLKLETCRAEAVMSTPIFKVKPEESLWTVQQIVEQRSIRRLAVTGEQGELLGIVTQTSLLQALNPLELYKLVQKWEEKVVRLEAQKVALLANRNLELQQQVEARTAALNTKVQREKLVADLATQIRSSLSLQTILDTTVQQVRQVLGCDRVNIWRFEADREIIVVAESTDSSLSLLGQRVNETCYKQDNPEIYRQGYVRVVPDISTANISDCHRQMLIRLQTKAKILVPLLCGDELWGLLNASESQHPRDWQPEEVELIQALSAHLAIAIGQATIHQKLQNELVKRERIEATLIESEQRYASLAAAAPVGIFRTDAEGLCTYVNDRYFQISGLTTGATIGQGWQQGVHPDDRDWVIAQWEQFIQGNDSFELEYRFQRPDGEVTWVYGQCVAELDANGHRIGYIGTITDISDRKRTEVRLQESEERYASLVEAVPVGIFRADARGKCIYVNDRWFQISGLTPKTAFGEGWQQGLHPDDRDQVIAEWEQFIQGNRSFQLEYRFQRPDGAVAWVYGQSVPELDADGQVVGYVGTTTDISDRKLAETALIQSEAHSRAILAAVPDFMFRIGADGIYRGSVTANRQLDFLGGTDFDTPGVAMVDMISGEIATRHLHHLEQALRTGELQVYEQQVHIGPRLKYEEVRVVKSGEDEALFMIRDVTARKQAERQLYQLNQQLEAKVEERTQELWQVNSLQRAILDCADYSIISVDPTGIIQTFNAAAERMLGYSAAEVVGKATPALIHDANEVIDRASSLSAELGQNIPPGFELFVAKVRQGIVSEEEWSYIRKDGSRFPVSLSISTLKDVNQQIIGFLGIAKDISDRKRAEAELQTVSDRLALALKSGAIGCWDFDLVQNTVFWDERMYELYGVTKQSHSPLPYDIWANRLHPEDRTATETLLQQALLGQAEFDTEFRVLHPDGSLHFIKAYGVVVPDAQGNPQSMIGVNFDISRGKQAELQRQQLIQELSAFKQALDQSAIVVITDRQGVISYVNDPFCAISGYSRDELMGKTHRLVNSGYHPPAFFQDLWQTITSGHVWRGEICNQAKNGSLYWVASTIVPFLDEGGRPFQYLAIRFDITDRKFAEATLRQENTFRQQIVENMTEGLCVFYEVEEFPFVRFTVWNQQMQTITGYTLEEINRLGWYHSLYLNNQESQKQTIADLKKIRQGGNLIAVEREIRRPDGQCRTISFSTSILLMDDEHLYVLGLIQDITDRQQTELENRLLKERLEFLLASSPAMIYSCKPYGDYGATFMSKNIEAILGYKPEEFLSECGFWANHIHPEDAPRVFTHLSALFEHNTHQHEYRFLHRDGHYVWLRDELRLLRDEEGTPIEIVGYFADISDVKQTEETLKRQLAAIEAAIDGIAIMQGDTYLYLNQAHLELFGYEHPQELVGKSWKLLYSQHELERFEREVLPVLGRDRAWEGEAIATRKDGSTFAEGLSLTLTEDGLLICVCRDISDRKQIEAQLAESEAKFRRLVEGANDLIWSCEPDGMLTYLSPQFKTMFGWDESEWIGKPFIYLVHLDDRPLVVTDYRENVKLGKKSSDYEFRHRHRDGNYVWVRSSARPVINAEGELISIQGIISDIRDRKQAELARESSEIRFRRVFESSVSGMMFADFHGNIIDANDRFLQMIGYTREELNAGMIHWDAMTPPEYAQADVVAMERLMQDGAIDSLEKEYYRKDGSRISVLIGSALLPGSEDQTICVLVDISDRKQAQKALQESQQFLQTVLDTIPLSVFWKNRESVFLGCNQQFAKTLGLPSTTESIGKRDLDICQKEVEANEYCAMDRRLIETGEAILGIEETLTLPNGKPIFLETHKAPLRDCSGNIIGLVGTFQDITHRKEAELRLQQQAKQERLLGAITKRMRSSLNLDEILNSTVEEIHQLLQSDRTLVYRVFPEGTGAAIAESVSPNRLKLLDILFPEEVFPEENYDRYIQGKVYALNDREDENESILPCLVEFLAEIQVRAKLVVPIILNQTLWGLLIVHQCDIPRQWQDWEINLLKQIANQLAIAIQQSYLYEQVQSELAIRKETQKAIALQLQRQRTLGEIAQQIRESLDIKEILATVTQQVKEILQGDRIIVIRLCNGRSQIVEESVLTEFPALKNHHWDDQLWSQEILNHYSQGKPRIVPDIMTDMGTNCLVEYASVGEVKSKMVAPILQEVRSSQSHRGVAPGPTNKLWGVLVVHACREKRVWQESEAQLLQQIANQLAIAVQQASLFEQLQQELTERQQAQQQLTERNEQLAVSNQELARATRLKDEFLANMSHELRTPLNAILGMSEGLQEQVFGIVNEQQIKALQTIDRSSSHLLELINDILDVAKIESGQMELDCTPVSINHLCQSSLAFIKQQALQKRIQLEIKVPLNLPDLLIDERRMRQVLINLLNNAVKFTPNGGRITLEVSRQQPRADPDSADSSPHFLVKETLQISVIDTGIGIAPEHINKLFQPFIQIDGALNRQYAGTGLGLALVKRIVELHGGQVLLTSTVGVGSCFTIEFEGRHGGTEFEGRHGGTEFEGRHGGTEFEGRHGGIEFEGRHGGTAPTGAPSSVALESQTEPPIEPSGPEQGGSPLILVAEDNEANISTVSSYLRAKGYRILLAKNGEEAIALAKSQNPNLILMDIQMPGMDGLEAMQQIRLDPRLVDVPILALTALAMTADRDRCLAAGANDYLTKPVKLKQLASTIQHLLNSLVR
ncbi:PAS domain S-box protein [Microcoleus sp. Z1_A1]|uniref:PAS domain S-box protein n=1 Tax=Microcoleus sp. Z1_A1 TaxID=3055428 RepID=UPI002FCEE446